MTPFSPTATRRLIGIGIVERDAIIKALRNDKKNLGLQSDIADFRTGRVEGGLPSGETWRLLDRFRPRNGYGDFQAAYQEANADAIAAGMGELLSPLKAAYAAHTAVLDEARQAAGKSAGRLATLDGHCRALSELIDVVRLCVAGSPTVATTGKCKPGRPNTAERDEEWLVLHDQGVYKTKAALARHLKVDHSTLLKALKRASETREST